MAAYKTIYDNVHNSYVVKHKDKVVARIESELARKPGLFRKAQYHWHVTSIAGAPRVPFISAKVAIEHAIKLHKQQKSSNWKDPHNPLKKIGGHIDALGDEIWNSSRDPRFGHPDAQEKIQDLALLHAELVRKYNKHFGS